MPTRVLVLHWFGLDAVFRPAFDAALQQELGGRDRGVELYSETLEGYRFSPEANEQLMREYLQRRYAGRPLDVIVAVWDPAVGFLTRYGRTRFRACRSSNCRAPADAAEGGAG